MRDFSGYFRFEPKTIFLNLNGLDHFTPECLIASFHVGKINVRHHIGKQCQEAVSDHMPEIYDAVRGRTHELGIRLALGAAPGSLVQMVVGDGVRLTVLGAALGIAGALAAGRALASQLYGVPAWDPLTIGLATLTVLAAAIGASLLPARRAAAVDPATALRAD